jgi:hypothetical protein
MVNTFNKPLLSPHHLGLGIKVKEHELAATYMYAPTTVMHAHCMFCKILFNYLASFLAPFLNIPLHVSVLQLLFGLAQFLQLPSMLHNFYV